MRNPLVALALSAAFCSACSPDLTTSASEGDDLIYGQDNRKEVLASTAAEQGAARAVAVLFTKSSESSCSGANCTLSTSPYASWFSPQLCSDEPFKTQNTIGFCTGFLVGPDLVATAGHCVTSQSSCAGIGLHFKFEQPLADTLPLVVPASDVYSCQTLVGRTQTSTDDWAIIRLDRPVAGVTPLCIRRSGQPAIGAAIEVIGHPYTLPKKVAAGAQVKSNEGTYFTSNLDTYGGNSGSPVLDAATLQVQGILVRGNNDYVTGTDASGSCTRSNVCTDADGCSGTFEEVSQITQVASLVPAVDCYAPAGGGCAACDDGNPCTDDTCDAAGVCTHTNNTASCSDANACTAADHCAAGACVPGSALDCTTGNVCLVGSCSAASGCVSTPAADGTTCPGGTCQSGTCTSAQTCATFTGTLSSQTKSRTHEIGDRKAVTIIGTLSCAPGSTADYDLFLEAYKSRKWSVVSKSIGPTCADRVSYTVGQTTQRLRWRVQRYTGKTNEAYSLSSCPK